MNDQAERLRQKIQANHNKKQTKVIAIVSGKGGVGKSNFSLNFSLALQKQHKRVLIFDMDIGMGNIDVLMGKTSSYTIVDFFNQNLPLQKIILQFTDNVDYIGGGTGLSKLMEYKEEAFERFASELEEVLGEYDYIIFDMGAGIGEADLHFILSVDDIIVITLPEPPAIMDAYSVMKHLYILDSSLPQYLIINRTQSEREGTETAQRLMRVSKSFLGKDIISLGMIPDDKNIKKSVSEQKPLMLHNDRAPAARAIKMITEKYTEQTITEKQQANPKQFINKLKRFFFKKDGDING